MKKTYFPVFIVALFCFLSSCSINKLAMNMIADALTGEGGADVFTSDYDPQLVGDAIPFAIKMYESLLSQNPDHQGLILTTGSLFVMYANAYIQGPAEMLPHNDWQGREAAQNRAKNMYLRGYSILYDGLESKYRGFKQGIANENTRQSFLDKLKKEDVGLLYWTVAGGLSAFSIDIMDFELSARIPEWNFMIHRAYELDPDFGGCALDEFFIIFYASLPDTLGGDPQKALVHYQRAIEKSKGTSTGAYLAYAQNISIPAQDYESYESNLKKTLDIDINIDPSNRLVNVINQRKAKWLLDNAWQFFSFLPIPDDF